MPQKPYNKNDIKVGDLVYLEYERAGDAYLSIFLGFSDQTQKDKWKAMGFANYDNWVDLFRVEKGTIEHGFEFSRLTLVEGTLNEHT